MCDRADIRRAEGLKNRRMIVSKDFYTPPLPYPAASRDVALKSKQEQRQFNRKTLTLLPCVAEQYRGDTSETVVSEERG